MEYSIVNYKNVCKITDDFRFDADYFRPKYLKEDKQRANFKNIYIRDFCYVTDGQHGYHEVDENSPIFHLTAKNAKGWFANTEGADRLAKWVDDKNKRSSLRERDLILSTRGTVGFCALVMKEALPANIDQDVARIAINPKAGIEPEFLLTYLNCAFGQDWLLRNVSGMVQQGLPLDKVRNIPIPLLEIEFQNICKRVVVMGHKAFRNSVTLYADAEQTLLSELGLLNWKPKHRLSFVKKYSDTTTAGRIDAEYFQPMYEEILSRSKNKFKIYKAGEIFSFRRGDFIDTKYYVQQKTKRAYIRIKELSNNGTINSSEVIYLDDSFDSFSSNTLKENDIVMAIIGDTIGKSNLILKEFVGSYFSNNTGRFRLRPDMKDAYDPFYLETLFHSIYIQSQIERAKAQTGQPKIADKEVQNIIIPYLPLNKQKEIGENIKKAIENKDQSKHLLDIAKRGVEIAIEKSEKDAQNWIAAELKKLNVDLN